MATGLLEGRVYHARTKCVSSPIEHAFSYPVWMALIDLDQLEQRPETIPDSFWCKFTSRSGLGLAKWRREDHFGSRNRLSEDVRELVSERTGRGDIARIELLTNLSCLGAFNFNPVSIYYCYSSAGDLAAALLEVSNTPWHDKRMYVLSFDGETKRMCWEKDFHVSPFMDMSHFYVWTLKPISPEGRLTIHAISKRKELNQPVIPWTGPHVNGGAAICPAGFSSIESLPTSFVVKLDLRKVPNENHSSIVLRNPVMPLAAVLWIHIEAFRVWYRGVEYVTPPLKSRALSLKDALVHLVVFAIAAFVRYGVILPVTLLRRVILSLTGVKPRDS